MNSDDPKFTAHVLGESEDLTAAERAEIEALLASDPAAAAEAGETRALAARLRAELPGEAAAGLEDSQREAVLKAATSIVPAGRVVSFPRRTTMLTASAAALVVGVTAGLVYRELREAPVGSLPMKTRNLSEDAVTFASSSLGNPKALASPLPPSAPAQQVQFGNITIAQVGNDHASRPSMEMPSAPQIDALALTSTNTYTGTTAVDAGAINGFSSTVVGATGMLHQTGFTEFNILAGTDGRQPANAVTSTIQTTLSGSLNLSTNSTAMAGSAEANRSGDHAVTGLAMRDRAAGFGDADASELSNVKALTIAENAFRKARENPLSTFGGDVGTASYALVRRYLEASERPPRDVVRIEELLNYFTYGYPPPQGDRPFTATLEVAECPWMPEHRLARIGVRVIRDVNVQVEFNPAQVDAYRLIGYEGRSLPRNDQSRDRKEAGEINAGQTVTALYELVPARKELPPLAMLDKLKDQPEREQLRDKDVEQPSDPLSRKAGVEAPIPPAAAAAADPAPAPRASAPMPKRKAAPQSAPTKSLPMPAPEPEAQAAIPQLLPSHEPKPLPEAKPAPRDGQTELLPPHVPPPQSALRPEREPKQKPVAPYLVEQETRKPVSVSPVGATSVPATLGRESLTLRLRYQAPGGDTSKQLVFPFIDPGTTWEQSSPDFRFTAAVAGYGLLLRDSNYRGQATWQSVAEWAREGLGADVNGRRAEFLGLVEKAKALSP